MNGFAERPIGRAKASGIFAGRQVSSLSRRNGT
jgi:hypothetical protein